MLAGPAAARAASAAGLLAQMLEYYRGSRVEAFEPLFTASAAACSAACTAAGTAGSEGSPAGRQQPLAKQLLRLLSALLIAHAKVRAAGQLLGSCDKL